MAGIKGKTYVLTIDQNTYLKLLKKQMELIPERGGRKTSISKITMEIVNEKL